MRTAALPPVRAQAGPVIYVCGGVSWDGRVLFNDMHCLELATKTWRQVGRARDRGPRLPGLEAVGVGIPGRTYLCVGALAATTCLGF